MKNISLALFFVFIATTTFAQTSGSNTAEEIAVLDMMNQARTNPKGFADKYIAQYKSSAAKECVKQMRKMKPLHTMKMSEELTKAARDHVQDTGPKGQTSHTGSDGSQMSDRIERYCQWEGSCGENIQYGYHTALEIVVDLLIDDGVPSRGHRKNILSSSFNYVGVAIGEHSEYEVMCVTDFAGGVKKK